MLAPILIDLQHLGQDKGYHHGHPPIYNCAISKQTSQVLASSLVTLTSSQSLFSPSPVSHSHSPARQRVVCLPSLKSLITSASH